MDSAVSQIEDVGVVRNSSMATSKHRIHRVSLVRGLRVVDLGKRDNNMYIQAGCVHSPQERGKEDKPRP